MRYVKHKNQINRQEMVVDKIQTFCHMLNDVRINHQISKSFEGLAKCMTKMNQMTDPVKMAMIIRRYEMESDKLEINQELIDDKSMCGWNEHLFFQHTLFYTTRILYM